MILQLTQLPDTLKGPDGDDYHGRLPDRALYLRPDAAKSLLPLDQRCGGLTYTDIFRSAAASLKRRQELPGKVQPPAYSPHNYGLAVDLDLKATMKSTGMLYPDLLDVCAKHGWYCHRRDGKGPDADEAWHLNYLGLNASLYLAMTQPDDHTTWARPAEERILERHRFDFQLTSEQVQWELHMLKAGDGRAYYEGRVDGVVGPVTRQALERFRRDWQIKESGEKGERTMRVLAYLTAEVVFVDLFRPVV